MEASRKYDAIASDRLTVWSNEALEREHEAAGDLIKAEQYGRLLHLLAFARSPLHAQGCGWLHTALYNAALQLVQNLDPTLSPLDSYVVDADTTREMVKLYGDKTRFMEDERALDLDEGRIGTNGLYDFEGR